MDGLTPKATTSEQTPQPWQLQPILSKFLKVFSAFAIGCFISLLVITYKHTGSNWDGFVPLSQVALELADNRTTCLVEVPPERAQKPAVGFDLTDSYGTATILLPSGNMIYIGPINGSKEYLDAMDYFSKNSSKHTAFPYHRFHDPPGDIFAGYWDMPRQLLRSSRKKVGLPSSSQVEGLASLLVDLRVASSNALALLSLNSTIDAVVLSSIDLGALYDEDLYDAALYAGLSTANVPGPPPMSAHPFPDTLMTDKKFQRQPKHVDAAQMGVGIGLCHNYTSTAGCEREEREMMDTLGRDRNLLSVYVTQRGLGLESRIRKPLAGTEKLSWQQHDSYFNNTLGINNLLEVQGEQEKEDEYWQGVKLFIEDMVTTAIRTNVTDIFMIGEKAGFPGFRENVVQAVMEAGLPKQKYPPVVHRDERHSIHVASRGAAEMARRVLIAPRFRGYPEGFDGVPRCRP